MSTASDEADGQLLFACDEDGRPSGEHVLRGPAHTGEGHRHLAIVVALRNRRGALLLQRRKHRLFNGLWDLTGATHPLHLANGVDETFEEAGQRCLRDEYGIVGVALRSEGGFAYFARDGARCENEFCVILVGEYDAPVTVDPVAGYACRWVCPAKLVDEIAAGPEGFAPWAVSAVERLVARGVLPGQMGSAGRGLPEAVD